MARSMEAYAREQVAHLLDRLAYQVGSAAKQGDEDTIRDLLAAIRRFSHALRVFGQFLPRDTAPKIRRKLKRLRQFAAEVRNRDIAARWIAAARVPARSPLLAALRAERDERQKALAGAIKAWKRRSFSRKWRERLEL